MSIKTLIAAVVMLAASVSASAQEWNSSVGVTVYGRDGSVSIGASNYPQPQVIYQQPPVVVYPQQPVVIAPPTVIYPGTPYTGRYAVPDNGDPYRNHRHLIPNGHHHHHHGYGGASVIIGGNVQVVPGVVMGFGFQR